MRFLQSKETDYFKVCLESGNPDQQKWALQRICKLYNKGIHLPNNERYRFRLTLNGIAMGGKTDPKVRRWCLNALALIGTKDSLDVVQSIISRFADNPEILGSSISALAHIAPDELQRLVLNDRFPRESVALAAMRTMDVSGTSLANIRIDIENSEPEILKLALLTVGLDKAPPHIFHPRFTNAEIVKSLGKHDDPIVTQYTVWAISENDNLGVLDLGVDIRNLDGEPENVRGWVYRLYAEDTQNHNSTHDLVVMGSEDDSHLARTSLAEGLRDKYYDGLEETVLSWHLDENTTQVQLRLIDHMILNEQRAVDYRDTVIEVYASNRTGTEIRKRIEATASGTKLYPILKEIDARPEEGLFDNNSRHLTMGNTYNINNIQTGSIALDGNSSNNGNINNNLNQEQYRDSQKILSDAEETIKQLPDVGIDLKEVLAVIQQAKGEPNRPLVEKAIGALKLVQNALKAGADTAGNAAKIGGYIMSLLAIL